MKKFFLAFFLFLASGAYIFSLHQGSAVATAPTASTQTTTSTGTETPASGASSPPPTATNSGTSQSTGSSGSNTTPTPAPVTKPKGQYTDGTYTGSTADAYYGYVQVKAVISGGKLTDVVFLQYPNDRSTSRYINQQAMPLLKEEAISAQNANVSGVSGASDTSMAFRESLGNALSQAKS